MSETRREAK